MTTRQVLLDLGRCLRAAAPSLLVLATLTLTGNPRSEGPTGTSFEHLAFLAWWAAFVVTAGWFVVAVVWAATRPLRDRRAFLRLQCLREIATPTDRALVHVQTTLWSSTAGQHAVVVNVATGATSRVWLPETTVPIGAFVVLERTDSGVSVVDWMNAYLVEAGHRHEARRAGPTVALAQRPEHAESRQVHEVAAELVRETEEFLRSQ